MALGHVPAWLGADEEEAADDEEDDLVSYHINTELHEIIAHPLSGNPANIKLFPSQTPTATVPN